MDETIDFAIQPAEEVIKFADIFTHLKIVMPNCWGHYLDSEGNIQLFKLDPITSIAMFYVNITKNLSVKVRKFR